MIKAGMDQSQERTISVHLRKKTFSHRNSQTLKLQVYVPYVP